MAKRSTSGRRGKRRSESSNWKRSPITGGIAALLILFCLYTLFKKDTINTNYKMDLICENSECSLDKRLERPEGESMVPYTCPDCNQKTLYQSQLCTECNKHTPVLAAKINFSCLECNYSGDHRLDSYKGPHPCPKCKKKSLAETYKCSDCKHVFAHQMKVPAMGEEGIEGAMAMDIGYMDMFMPIPCPKCKKEKAMSINQERIPSCKFCESVKLKSITPSAVIKWELGRPLKAKEQKIVDEWKAKQGL